MNKQLSNTEILEKAILKAAENGYGLPEELAKTRVTLGSYCEIIINDYRALIFMHNFAKGFWGEEKTDYVSTYTCADPSCKMSDNVWENHLQQMVLEEDPLEYLKQFLDE